MSGPREHLQAAARALAEAARELDLLAQVLPEPAAGVEAERDLTVVQLADLLDVSPSSARAWVARGELPGAYRLHGKAWRVPQAALVAFRDRQEPSTAIAAPTSSASPRVGAQPRKARGPRGSADLGAWRRERRAP